MPRLPMLHLIWLRLVAGVGRVAAELRIKCQVLDSVYLIVPWPSRHQELSALRLQPFF